MAAQPQDTKTEQLPNLTPTERQWVRIGLDNIAKGIIRNRANVAPGAMHNAMTADLAAVNNLKEKFQ